MRPSELWAVRQKFSFGLLAHEVWQGAVWLFSRGAIEEALTCLIDMPIDIDMADRV